MLFESLHQLFIAGTQDAQIGTGGQGGESISAEFGDIGRVADKDTGLFAAGVCSFCDTLQRLVEIERPLCGTHGKIEPQVARSDEEHVYPVDCGDPFGFEDPFVIFDLRQQQRCFQPLISFGARAP